MSNVISEIKIWAELILRFLFVVLVGALSLAFTLTVIILGTVMWMFGITVTVNKSKYRWFRKL